MIPATTPSAYQQIKPSSWFSNSHIRLYLDVIVGAARHDQDQDRKHAGQVSDKLRDLTDKLRNIRREQQYQREREAEFRNLSEATNSRAMWYMVVQLIVLITTCYLQLRHLRVRLLSSLSQGYGLIAWCSTSSQIGRQYRVGMLRLTITFCLYTPDYITYPRALIEQFSLIPPTAVAACASFLLVECDQSGLVRSV
jgi:hypothetical protein